MKYKDQYGTIEYWKDSNVWAGKLIGISDLVTYESDTYGGLWTAFVAAVDDYLKEIEIEEQVPCKTHPDAPHGFDRNASHSLDRYVCRCEHWEPEE